MKKMSAVALSVLLSPLMSVMTAANAASSECDSCVLQPGRLETAREIKNEGDAFVARGRVLSEKLNERISAAERLRAEAIRLESQAILIAESSESEAPRVTPDTKPANADSKTTGATDTTPGASNSATSNSTTPGSATNSSTTNSAAADSKKSETLSGRASQLQTVAPPNIPLIKLKGPQLQQAQRQFNIDVEQFKVHANDYNKSLAMFRSQIGECQAAKHAFDELHKKYEMHCDAYHLNNIPPPHLCLEMNVSEAEASGIANRLMNDQMRALRAEAQLNAEEGKLRQLEGMQGAADGLVVKATDRARRERDIAGMFGRLRQEYDLLEIERRTIEASKGGGKPVAPVARPYVTGKIKKGK